MLFAVFIGQLFAPSPTHAQTICRPVNALFLVDTSGSMNDNDKLPALKRAMNVVLDQFKGRLRIGLMTFSGKSAILQAPLGPLNPADQASSNAHINAMKAKLNALKASGETPLNVALKEAKAHFSKMLHQFPEYNDTNPESKRRTFLFLLTDGYDSSGGFDPVVEVQRLRGYYAGLQKYDIKTFVIGLGNRTSMDTSKLQAMAVVGGTEPFSLIEKLDTLTSTLTDLTRSLTAESCNNIDDNCDGQIDEDVRSSCSNDCGKGTSTCSQGEWSACNISTTNKEVCDGKDNDCNGKIDDGELCPGGQCLKSKSGRYQCVVDCTPQSCTNGTECDPNTKQCVQIITRTNGSCGSDGDCKGAQEICFENKCVNPAIPPGCGCNLQETSMGHSRIWLLFLLLFGLRFVRHRRH